MFLKINKWFRTDTNDSHITDEYQESVGNQPSKLISLESRVMLDASAFPLAVDGLDADSEASEVQPSDHTGFIPLSPKALLKAEKEQMQDLSDNFESQDTKLNATYEDKQFTNSDDFSELLSTLDLNHRLKL